MMKVRRSEPRLFASAHLSSKRLAAGSSPAGGAQSPPSFGRAFLLFGVGGAGGGSVRCARLGGRGRGRGGVGRAGGGVRGGGRSGGVRWAGGRGAGAGGVVRRRVRTVARAASSSGLGSPRRTRREPAARRS